MRTPVWCGYCPVKVADRDTQQRLSTTKECGYDAPSAAIRLALRSVGSRSMEKSSMSTKTMFGLFDVAWTAALADGCTDGSGRVETGPRATWGWAPEQADAPRRAIVTAARPAADRRMRARSMDSPVPLPRCRLVSRRRYAGSPTGSRSSSSRSTTIS